MLRLIGTLFLLDDLFVIVFDRAPRRLMQDWISAEDDGADDRQHNEWQNVRAQYPLQVHQCLARIWIDSINGEGSHDGQVCAHAAGGVEGVDYAGVAGWCDAEELVG